MATDEKARSRLGLDLLNVLMADLQTGIGPFLAIYLTSVRAWDPRTVGAVIAAQSLITVCAQGPGGAFVDWVDRKKWLLVAGGFMISVGCVGIVAVHSVPMELVAQTIIGLAAAIFVPAVSAVSIGVVGRKGLSRRIARNEIMYHIGNTTFALVAGVVGEKLGQHLIFIAAAGASLLAGLAAATVLRTRDIDVGLARESTSGDKAGALPLREVFLRREVIGVLGAVVLFHFTNGAMLTLIGEILAHGGRDVAPYMAGCIVVAQVVMLPVALVAGRLADRLGRKPLFLFAFGALVVRALVFTTSENPIAMVSFQALDAFGAGVFGVLWAIVAADLARGTGRFGLLQGAVQAALGAGVFLGNLASGFIVHHTGYRFAFVVLAGVAACGFLVYAVFVPETGERDEKAARGRRELAVAH